MVYCYSFVSFFFGQSHIITAVVDARYPDQIRGTRGKAAAVEVDSRVVRTGAGVPINRIIFNNIACTRITRRITAAAKSLTTDDKKIVYYAHRRNIIIS